jgi:colanic acid/amylovoran biosynthesis glycosyltransferase
MSKNSKPLIPEIGVIAMVPDEWNAPWQPRHHVLARLSRYFHVVWLNPAVDWREMLRREKPSSGENKPAAPLGLMVYSSRLFPKLHRPWWLANFCQSQRLKHARSLLTGQGCKKIILYLWRPEFEYALTSTPFDASCYHIDDEYSFSEVDLPPNPSEMRLIAEVNQVFIHSRGLLEKKGAINLHTVFVPNGCDCEAYSTPAVEPADLAGIPRPRIGYTGRIKRQLDWPLLLDLSSRHPEWSFVFVGPRALDPEVENFVQKMSNRRNVYFLGSKSQQDLAAYPQHFDVCIMPYRMNDYTQYIYPLKLHEYLASGRPIVGSPIRSLQDFDHVIKLAETTDAWSQALRDSLAPGACSSAQVEARRSVARKHDWDKLVTLVAQTLCMRLGPAYREQFEKICLREPHSLSHRTTERLVSDGPVSLQRCDQFVGRTMNWLYDHLRFVPRYTPFVICDALLNREEFPELNAWRINPESLPRRVWRRLARNRVYPFDRRRLRLLAPRVLHSHFGYVALGDYTLHRMLEVPWFVGFYGADVYTCVGRARWEDTYGRLFEQVTRVLALGPEMKTQLERLGCPKEKVIVHPLGVDVQNLPGKLRVLGRGETLKILFAGTFREKKGLQYVIEAAAIARRAGVRLNLCLVGDEMGKAGDRETKEGAFQLVRRLDLEDVVVYCPFLKFEELVSLALKSHVFVAPSVTAEDGDAEGTPFVLQQMMVTGMPAIATMHSDIPYLFGEHAHLLVPERDARAIADRLQRYADDPDSLVTDGTALRDRIRHAFDVSQCAARLSDLYDEALGIAGDANHLPGSRGAEVAFHPTGNGGAERSSHA